MASRPTPQDNLEMKAIKAMGAMEEGDAVFGSSDEVNLDSQVSWLLHLCHTCICISSILMQRLKHNGAWCPLVFKSPPVYSMKLQPKRICINQWPHFCALNPFYKS